MTADRYLLIKAKGGFGNRILSAVTGIALAEAIGRVPVVDWRDGHYAPRGVNAYTELFDSPDDVDVAAFDHRTDVAPPIWAGRLGEFPVDLVERFYPREHSNPFVYRKLAIDLARPHRPEPVAVFWSYLPKAARIRRHLARRPDGRRPRGDALSRDVLDRWFQPNKRVRTAVEELFADRPGPVIGVHIRYTDRKVSLDRIAREIRRLRHRMPAAPIFLATDNEQVQRRFRAEFSGVFVIEKVLGDDSTTLQGEFVGDDERLHEAENALIDMWALASCDWLVHSRHSTFSVAAALIGGIPRARQRDVDRWNPRVVLKRWVQTWA